MRNAGQEVSLYRGALPQASSVSLAAQLLGRLTSASRAAIRAETQIRVQEVLNGMGPLDREVLTLRHFEMLSNEETAAVLGVKRSAASNRYVRRPETAQGIAGGHTRFRLPVGVQVRRSPCPKPPPTAIPSKSWRKSLSCATWRGERPALTEHTNKYPSRAGEIRDLFSALLMMEDIRPGDEDATRAEPGKSLVVGVKKLEAIRKASSTL